ncbi:hypothetical protein [Sphingobium tyrosinilyticum]|uniref:Uncharacterized protein n=1 Tax=Sphingobium tyrosinilyticum TaxID=2715436 RepID=A0ABV9F0T6_9SPHN
MPVSEFTLAAERLAQFDVSQHQARIAEAEAERAKIDAGVQHGMHELNVMSRRIADLKYGPRVDADQAADALMSKGEVQIEVDTLEKLETERAGLNAGMKRLREREADAARTESEAKNAAHQELAGCVAELAPILLREAQQALEQLATVYAGAVALAEGAGSTAARGVAERISRTLAEANEGGLLENGRIPVPSEMLTVLEAGRGPIEQLGRRWHIDVTAPLRPINLALVALGQENANLRSQIALLQAAR